MSKIRMIGTDFWSDTWIDSLDPIEKLIYLYCITNDKSSWCGATEIPIKKIGYETGIDRDMVLKIIDKFSKENKVIYIDGYLILKNFIKHHFSGLGSPDKRSKNNQLKAIIHEMEKLPKNVIETLLSISSEASQIAVLSDKLKDKLPPCKGIVPLSSPLPSSLPSSLEETTPVGVHGKGRSIINKHNKPGAIQIYDKIKEMCVVVDGSLDDCVVLRSKLEKYGDDPVKLLELMITKMRDTGLNKFYSVSNPGKIAEHISTIIEKLKAETNKTQSHFIPGF